MKMAQAVLLDSGFLIRLMNPDFGFIDIRKDTPNLTGGSR
jgi:hypothetical protein